MTNVEEEMDNEKTALKTGQEMTDFAGEDGEAQKDPMAVRFVNGSGKTDDYAVDMTMVDPVEKKKEEEFVCLKKDELEKFSKDPYWVRLRIILLVFFGLVWVGMLVAAIVIIVVAPKCPPRPYQEWWETAVIYRLNPRSFLDTNGDGKGDIKGIQKQLPYLKDSLKVSALILGPLYPSMNDSFGYDVTDYISISNDYGTMDDFVSLQTAMHKQGMKLILDFIPNHTSRKHDWFTASHNAAKEENSYKDFYIWNAGSVDANGTKTPPNNWLNVYGEPAWTLDEVRGEFYYHSYTKDEPDLNLSNANVIKKLDEALLFWLQNKVDGFNIIGAEHLIDPSNYLQDNNTNIQDGTYKLIAHWRELLNNYSYSPDLLKSRRFPRLLIADVTDDGNEKFYGSEEHPGAHLVTNKVLHALEKSCDTNCIHSLLESRSKTKANGKHSNWQVGDQDTSRITTRMGSRSYVNAINMLLMTLPGTPMIYNGDELGMKNAELNSSGSYSIPQDLISRAGQLSPMQWSDKEEAGFTSGHPWLPVADDFHEVNVEAQTAHGSGMSPIKVFKSLVDLKAEPSFQWGQFNVTTEKSILLYIRQAEGFAGYLIAINFGPKVSTVKFKDSTLKDLIPNEAKVVASTHNFEGPGRAENYEENTTVMLNNMIYLKPTEGIVLKWEPSVSYL